RLPAVAGLDRLDQAALFEARDRAIERAGPQIDAGKLENIGHHRVPVLVAFGEAGEHEERGIGHRYYVSRNIAERNRYVKYRIRITTLVRRACQGDRVAAR